MLAQFENFVRKTDLQTGKKKIMFAGCILQIYRLCYARDNRAPALRYTEIDKIRFQGVNREAQN